MQQVPKPSNSLGVFLVLFVILMVGVNKCSPVPSKLAGDANSIPKTTTIEPLSARDPSNKDVVKVTAAELGRDYDDNELAAQQKYGGQILEVTGRMRSVDLDMSDTPTLILEIPKALIGLHAGFEAGATAGLETLRKGQSATVRCAEVTEMLGTPILKRCAFVR